ncbi:DUF1178 family protein [Limnohabitans sp. Rim8]|jgi:hypothetical protein|uniref:DUF1178 family protein n=1 Tax=Limnohabitans sp. Rim8 TaxID=1100718 RepID=UPI0025D6B32A|nr:DUF1178 family protein [Limnohabitans sp. Rim8]
MKVLDLQCAQGHSFEGWFGSQDDYDSQRARGLVTCPVCQDSDILKKLSAPRLNLGHGVAPDAAQAPVAPRDASNGAANWPAAAPSPEPSLPAHSADPAMNTDTLQQMQAAMMKMVRHVLANTEDVGSQFAQEARKIHYGERQERHIRGQATREETEALIDEGIDVMPLPVPENLKGPLH